jgi:hypothetical protein
MIELITFLNIISILFDKDYISFDMLKSRTKINIIYFKKTKMI